MVYLGKAREEQHSHEARQERSSNHIRQERTIRGHPGVTGLAQFKSNDLNH